MVRGCGAQVVWSKGMQGQCGARTLADDDHEAAQRREDDVLHHALQHRRQRIELTRRSTHTQQRVRVHASQRSYATGPAANCGSGARTGTVAACVPYCCPPRRAPYCWPAAQSECPDPMGCGRGKRPVRARAASASTSRGSLCALLWCGWVRVSARCQWCALPSETQGMRSLAPPQQRHAHAVVELHDV